MAVTTSHSSNAAGTSPEAKHESIHAKRPVESGDWFGNLALDAWEKRGSLFDFAEPDDLALTILGSGEIFGMMKRSRAVGDMSLKAAVKRARKEVPGSFRAPMTLTTEGLDIHNITEATGLEHVVVLKVAGTPELTAEYDAVTTGIDLTAGRWHEWRGLRTPIIKLATVTTREYVSQEFLAELFEHVPAEIQAQPGFVRPVELDDLVTG